MVAHYFLVPNNMPLSGRATDNSLMRFSQEGRTKSIARGREETVSKEGTCEFGFF